MRLASLSTSNYSTPRMAGLQARSSSTNTAPQKADAFTPSAKIQRTGLQADSLEQLIAASAKRIKKLTNARSEEAQQLLQTLTAQHPKIASLTPAST